ncbi:MAG: hypothetical protein LVQ96_03465 [Thermoplasmatales archaeon]|nr:hypothetical protein [Thermoplasmatales archaeon]MCW6170209.1 hypothetical protein [Thermoplasmatales archaeon]
MRKKLLLIGIIILVVGIVFAAVGAFGADHFISTSTLTLTKDSQGIFASKQIEISSGNLFTVASKSNSTYLVRFGDLSFVNSSNIGKYEVPPLTKTSVDSVTSFAYDNISGTFAVVSLSSSTSTVTTELITDTGAIVAMGLLLILGIVLAIAGVIITIVGAILKPKNVNGTQNYGFNR